MKAFIINILIFSVIYLSVCTLFSCLVPYHWGNPWYSSKIQYLESYTGDSHNTFFFGSSRVYRQIAPNAFDSTYNSVSERKIRSYNLGAPATFTPQTYFLYENFLNSQLSHNAGLCFVELMEVDLPSADLQHQQRTTYWHNNKELWFVARSIWANRHLRYAKKAMYFSRYLTSYVENKLHLGHFGQQLMTEDYYDIRYNGPLHDGFLSMEEDQRTTKDKTVAANFLDKRKEYLENPDIVNDRKKRIIAYHNEPSVAYDEIHLHRILELIRKSEARNINLIFILSPRHANRELFCLSRQIPPHNIIDMSDPDQYGAFYTTENSYDNGHLNTTGACLYSDQLARAALKLAQ